MKRDLSKVAPSIVSIRSDLDIIAARMAARDTARKMGFSNIDQARIATATSELTRNIFMYAREGSVTISEIQNGNRRGIEIIFEDKGPGIPDMSLAIDDSMVVSGTSGFGLSGSRRLMDQMDIETTTGVGTKVTCYKWMR